MTEQGKAVIAKYKAKQVELAKEFLIEFIEVEALPALQEYVSGTKTPVDDLVLAAGKEPLKQALMQLLGKL